MTMNNSQQTLRSYTYWKALLFAVVMLGTYAAFGASSAEAAGVTLSVNGGSSVSIDAGDTVTLAWQGSGVSSCSINNGIGSVGLSGSRIVTPPNNGATYSITCTGGSDNVTVSVRPYISMWSNPSTVTPATAGASGSLTLNWNAVNATQCSLLTARGLTNNVTRTIFSNVRPANSNVGDSINQPTLYTITCSNPQNGQSRTSTYTVNYGAPGDPLIETFDVNRTNPGTWDPNWAGVKMTINYTSTNAQKCIRLAYNATNTPYTLPGWTASATSASATNWIQGGWHATVPATTKLKLICGRTTDNKWDMQDLVFTVNPGSTTTPSATSLTADLIAPANIAVPSAADLPARVNVQIMTDYTNRCSFFAYNASTSATTTVSGWTNRLTDWFRREGTFEILLNESTRLRYQCTRTADGAVVRDDATVNVTVNANQPPQVTMTAVPTGMANNAQTVRLYWTGLNVNQCQSANVIQNGSVTDTWFTGTVPLAGVKGVSVYSNTTYSLTCTNTVTGTSSTGSVTVNLVNGEVVVDDSVTVNVNSTSTPTSTPPLSQAQVDAYRSSVTISANPVVVRQQETSNVTWTAHPDLIAGCKLYEGNEQVPLTVQSSTVSTSTGSFASRPLKVQRVFTIDCQIPTAVQTATFSASVRVLPKLIES